jgi:hypothetical protein
LILFIDAEECGRTSVSGSFATAKSTLHFGRDNRYPNRWFTGQLAHACLWRRALSPAEIQFYQQSPPKGDEPDVLGYYPLNDITTASGIPTAKNLGRDANTPDGFPDGRANNASIVTSNSIPVSCNNTEDRDAYQKYQHSGLKLDEQETGCYNSEFEWFFKSAVAVEPAASLYHGIVQSFNYNPNTRYDISDPLRQAPHTIVVGNNTAEAFSALLATHLNDSKYEPILNALQMNILSDLDQTGGAINVERQLHAARFGPAVEGQTWELAAIKDQESSRLGSRTSQASETTPKLTSELIELVNELNELQLGLKQYELQWTGNQRQLMADWRKFLYEKYTETKDIPLQSPLKGWIKEKDKAGVRAAILSILNAWIDQHRKLEEERELRENQLNQLKAFILSRLKDTIVSVETPEGKVDRGVLSMYYELTARSTSVSSYYQPNEICILLSGPGLETPINFRNCSERSDGFLECGIDLPQQLPSSSVHIPAKSATLSAQSLDKASGLTLAAYIKELEKLACLVANNIQPFTVCSPQISLTTKDDIESCWLPLLMDWGARVRPLKVPTSTNNALVYDSATVSTNYNWNKELTDLKEDSQSGLMAGQPTTLFIKNRLQLSAGVAVSLQNQINILIEKTDDPDSHLTHKLRKLSENLSNMNVMSQVLAGFNQGLLMRQETMQLPIWDPIYNPDNPAFDERSLITNVQDTVGNETYLGEHAAGIFSPLRGGRMQIAIEVIDCFGRSLPLAQSTSHEGLIRTGFIVAHSLTPADATVALNRFIDLPPRLVPPSRLHFNWICSQSLKRFVNSRDVNPILGWIIYNYLENSLDIYNADGRSIGSIFVVERDGRFELLSQGQPGTPSWTQPLATANGILADVVGMLAQQSAAYLQAFFTMLNNATTLTPSEAGNSSNVSVLVGKPLALVSAYLKLECNGNSFPLSQGWQEMRAVSETKPAPNMLEARNSQALNNIQFPILLGHENSVDDGLVGFFKHHANHPDHPIDTSCFYSQSASAAGSTSNSSSKIIRPKIDDLVLTTDPKHCQLVTMLIDPFKPVHLTSGILPVQSLQVSKDYLSNAIENMKSTFLLTPIISPPSFIDVQPEPDASAQIPVVRKLPMPTPSVTLTNGQWSWLQPEGTASHTDVTWEEYEPTDLACEIGVNFSPQTIQEGWLVLSHSKQQRSHGQTRSTSDRFIPPEPVIPAEVFCQRHPEATDTMD